MQKIKTYIVQFKINCILNKHVGGVACETIVEGGKWPIMAMFKIYTIILKVDETILQ